MKFKLVRRGDPEPEPNKLNLSRQLWLDFDGGGYTISDSISGSMTQGWRLEAGETLELGRAVLNGEPQFITTAENDIKRGVEVRRGAINLAADSRWEGGIRELPAVGWDHDFQSLQAVLHLPPGWSLFSSSGIDDVRNTWIQRWTLLDLFLVLIAGLAIGNLWGWRWGALALATLVLIWHEPGAPRTVWLHILGAAALLRVLPEGKIHLLVRSYRNAALLILIIIVVPFLINAVRTGLYPQLERPWQSVAPMAQAGRASVAGAMPQELAAMDAVEEMPAAMSSGAIAMKRAARSVLNAPQVASEAYYSLDTSEEDREIQAFKKRKLSMIDPMANVQTGPGVPRWEWTAVPLRWNGPVERGQVMQLQLISPRVNFILDLIRISLLVVLSGLLLGAAFASGRLRLGRAAAVLMLSAPMLSLLPPPAQADFPSRKMLDELKTRLTEAPECLPACAQIPRLRLEVDPTTIVIRMRVLAAADVAIPLPADARHWLPTDVSVDGAAAQDLYRTSKSEIWLRVREGQRQVILSGPIPQRKNIELPLPLRPRYVEVVSDGWQVEGVREDGRADAQLQLSRLQRTKTTLLPEIEPAALPPFVRVERTLLLGLDWRVETRVVRASPQGTAVVIEVPLLNGESVNTADIDVDNGRVQVSMAARQRVFAWESSLEKQAVIELAAPDTTTWTEIWKADVGPIWHAVPTGIAVIHHQNRDGQWLPEWRPWPGEQVSLAVSRPQGVEGRTLTIDQADVRLRPGKRATDVDLELSLRSSQGGQHSITLPEQARLQSVTIDGTAQPVRQEDHSVTLPVRPGAQQVLLNWREPHGIASRLVSPKIDLGAPSVNAAIDVTLGRDRWVLLTGGPRLGPAVLFWGVLIVIGIVAMALGRIKLTPLNSTAWLLLGIGLSQVHIWFGLIVVGWLLALGWRARLAEETRKSVFNLTQIGLAILTLAALIILFQAIKHGLLGLPDMQIGGNGSSAYQLLWYQDRSDEVLPRAWVLSAPLLSYRLLMLAWALWLAFALLRWLRWGWSCYSAKGLWRPFRLSRKPDSGPASEPAA